MAQGGGQESVSLLAVDGPGAGAGASFLGRLGAGAGTGGVDPTHLQHCASPYAQFPAVSLKVWPAAQGVPGAGWPAKFEPLAQTVLHPGASPPDRPVPIRPVPWLQYP